MSKFERGAVAMAMPPGRSRLPIAAPAESELHLADVLSILRAQWVSIALAALIALMLGMAYLALTAPTYSATTQLFVDPRSRRVLDAQMIPAGLGGDQALMESQEKIIRSFGVLDAVVKAERLGEDPELTSSLMDRLPARLRALIGSGRSGSGEAPQITAVRNLSRLLNVKRPSNTYVLEIEVTTKDPVKSARLSRAIAQAYIDDQAGAKADETQRATSQLEGRLNELREKVLVAERKVEEFRQQSGLLLASGGLINEQQLAQLNSSLIQAQTQASEAKARYERIQRLIRSGSGGTDTVSEASNSAVLQRLREQYSAATQRVAALDQRLRGGHPDLADARARQAAIQSQINGELRRIAETALSEQQIAQVRAEQIQERLDGSKRETNEKNQARVQLAELEREAAASRKVLEAFLSREKETREQQTINTPDARVISPAIVPTRPSAPNKPMVLALALLAGLGAGIARALIGSHLDRTVRGTADIERLGRMRVLGQIPELVASGTARAGALSWIMGRAPTAPPMLADLLEAVARPAGERESAYRLAIHRLIRRLQAGRRRGAGRRVLVAGPRDTEGKSSVAASLALAESLDGRRVLLIDADGRHATLTGLFAAGLLESETPPCETVDDLQGIVDLWSPADVAFLPWAALGIAGMGRQGRAAALAALEQLVARYDSVLIDAGGVLEDPAATRLAGLADTVVLLARAGVTRTEELEEAAAMLGLGEDTSAGIVLTFASPAAGP